MKGSVFLTIQARGQHTSRVRKQASIPAANASNAVEYRSGMKFLSAALTPAPSPPISTLACIYKDFANTPKNTSRFRFMFGGPLHPATPQSAGKYAVQSNCGSQLGHALEAFAGKTTTGSHELS